MSYTTRCPACGTMFKVVPDQLKISDGWVRCGHCADVFDATLYLEAWAPPPAAPERVAEPKMGVTPAAASPTEPEQQTSEPLPVDGSPAPTPAATEPVTEASADLAEVLDRSADSSTAIPIRPLPSEPAPVPVMPAQATDGQISPRAEVSAWAESGAGDGGNWLPLSDGGANAPGPDLEALPLGPNATNQTEVQSIAQWTSVTVPPSDVPPATETRLDPPPVTASPVEGATEFQTELERFAAASALASGRIRAAPEPAPEPAPPGLNDALTDDVAPAEEPGFVRQARRQALWRSPGVRAMLGLLGVLLGLLLAGQWALHERDRLAARHPDLAPLLARLCEPLGCAIGPVQRIDAVVIDSSTLVRRLGNFYSFDLVLRNTATMAVAVPALELTLTDSTDSVIARRVFLQQELPGTPELVPAQSTLALSLRLSINDVGAVPMAGYRALVFYP